MPGILPMKVIKVGTAAQSRIAQACDRCRSKKIRCDGVTPCCSQCSNVGFECKTSDKLSRRAFPRGYTESLEDRVRSLESEVKELKDLLDEKDEKIDILSKIHSTSPSLRRPSSTLSTSSDIISPKEEVATPKEDTFSVQQSPNLVDGIESDSYFMGASSGRQFVDIFKGKVQESGRPCHDFKTDSFFAVRKQGNSSSAKETTTGTTVPPRMVSDQLINIFFQEWAPLFPVLHRPTLLDIYEKYVTDPRTVKEPHAIAQLHLIFGISALSAEWNKQEATAFEGQWQAALEEVKEETTLQTLQCLILAQIHMTIKADYKKLQYYRGMAMPLSQRLGLYQSQKRFSLGALTCETRKKVFWTLYTLDCFTAAMLGLPKLLTEVDIHTEYPADIDDENVMESGFQPTLPGESTRLSSALALFRAARIMSKVLDEVYPAASSHEISLQNLSALNDQLDDWHKSLPAHLRLEFVQDKPSTNLCGSRSPILSLVFHYIRTLIHRPAVGSSLGHKADSSIVALAQSSKHIVQIIRLLDERRMCFSFCLNRNEILLLAGFGLLYQTLELDRKGKLIQDSQRLLCSVTSMLERDGAAGASEFKRITGAMISIERSSNSGQTAEMAGPRRKSDGTMHAPKGNSKGSRRLSTMSINPSVKTELPNSRRLTAPVFPQQSWSATARKNSQQSLSSISSSPTFQYAYTQPSMAANIIDQMHGLNLPNLDYLDFSADRLSNSNRTSSDALKTSYDDLHACTHAPSDSLFSSPDTFPPALSPSSGADFDWNSDLWMMPSDMPTASHSTLSFSEEELTSGEELSNCDLTGAYNRIKIPQEPPLIGLDELDRGFGL